MSAVWMHGLLGIVKVSFSMDGQGGVVMGSIKTGIDTNP